MKNVILMILLASHIALAQENPKPQPKVQDLDFLVGKWEITFNYYETREPEKGIVFTEKGQQICFYELNLNGVPMFITCEAKVKTSNGRTREFTESIRYSKIHNAFIRTGLFSNWPAFSREKVFYDPSIFRMEMRGELELQNGILERYEDVYIFNNALTSFERKNVANISDMPVTHYNLTITGTGKKIK